MTLEDKKMADYCKVRLSLIFPLILIGLAWGLQQIPWKMTSYASVTFASVVVRFLCLGFSL